MTGRVIIWLVDHARVRSALAGAVIAFSIVWLGWLSLIPLCAAAVLGVFAALQACDEVLNPEKREPR